MNRQRLGAQAEQLAMRYLTEQGLSPFATNYRCRYGEIDLIMRDTTTWVFVEVRYRRHHSHGGAGASVNHCKQRKLIRATNFWLQQHGQLNSKARIDVVAMNSLNTDFSGIVWIRGAVEGDTQR